MLLLLTGSAAVVETVAVFRYVPLDLTVAITVNVALAFNAMLPIDHVDPFQVPTLGETEVTV